MAKLAAADGTLALLLEEAWDVGEAIEELERRRDALRDAILDACRARGVDRCRHARGALRIERYSSYKVAKASRALPLLRSLRAEDKALRVSGRALHALADGRDDLRAYLDAAFPVVRHEVLVMTPARRR